MKPFHFQRFSIAQSQEVFRVGTDGVLLGALATCMEAQNILEVGTGTGLISLMLAQRNSNSQIFALDIDEKATELSRENFKNSPFSDRLISINRDFKLFETERKFDLIVCNPPYFEKMESSQKDVLARQQVELNFEQLIKKTAEILACEGVFSVIIPKAYENYFIRKSVDFGLKPHTVVNIRGNVKNEIKRCVLEFGFSTKNLCKTELVLESSPRKYSSEYIILTKDFHVFK